jgi:acetyl esterase/lipase
MVKLICFCTFLFFCHVVHAQKTIFLYPESIPGSKPSEDLEKTEESDGIIRISNISRPTLGIYLPEKEKANGTCIIIIPGGGYQINAIGHEGFDIAKKLVEMGITAFVVKYRIPNDATMGDKKTGPLQDAQQAISYVRKNAAIFRIDPSKIGILGFSAGGHLASTAGTHFENPVQKHDVSVRPDFMILVYPVISMQANVTHAGSRESLLGKNPSEKDITNYSNELQINEKTPPTFLVHASDDETVKVENSLLFYSALIKNKVPAELHVYQMGGHGFGLTNKTTQDLWMERCKNWMISSGYLK